MVPISEFGRCPVLALPEPATPDHRVFLTRLRSCVRRALGWLLVVCTLSAQRLCRESNARLVVVGSRRCRVGHTVAGQRHWLRLRILQLHVAWQWPLVAGVGHVSAAVRMGFELASRSWDRSR